MLSADGTYFGRLLLCPRSLGVPLLLSAFGVSSKEMSAVIVPLGCGVDSSAYHNPTGFPPACHSGMRITGFTTLPVSASCIAAFISASG